MTVELKWVPSMEASDHRKAGWIEIELHGGIEAAPGCFLMASPGEENEPAQPKPAAQVCPNCKEPGEPHYFFQSLRESSFASPTFVCEPAAPVEMPEVVADALIALRSGAFPNLANDLESFWRSQPVAVGISEELESVLRSAKEYEMAVRTGTRVEWHTYDADRIGAAIAAVREQYGRKG